MSNPTPPQSELLKTVTAILLKYHEAEPHAYLEAYEVVKALADFVIQEKASARRDERTQFSKSMYKANVDTSTAAKVLTELEPPLAALTPPDNQKNEHHFVHESTDRGEWVKETIYCTHCGKTPKELAALTPKTTKE